MFILIHMITYYFLIYHITSLEVCNKCFKSDFYSYYIKEYQQICLIHGCYDINGHQSKNNSLKKVEHEDMANNSGLNRFYRPRSALARALYEKQQNDHQLEELDKNQVRHIR